MATDSFGKLDYLIDCWQCRKFPCRQRATFAHIAPAASAIRRIATYRTKLDYCVQIHLWIQQ